MNFDEAIAMTLTEILAIAQSTHKISHRFFSVWIIVIFLSFEGLLLWFETMFRFGNNGNVVSDTFRLLHMDKLTNVRPFH